jgi:hypothetical protein
MEGLSSELWKGRTPANTQLVAFQWRDIRAVNHWNDESDPIRPARHITTAGYILYEGIDPDEPTEEIVVLGNHYDWEEERWSEFHCFPKKVMRDARVP